MNILELISSFFAGSGHPDRPSNGNGLKYWEEQGWKRVGNNLEGYYRTVDGSYKGLIRLFDSGKHLYHIYNPPKEIEKHHHWECFVPKGPEFYWIHFQIEPDCVDTGIIAIEKIIRESVQDLSQLQH